MTLTPADDDDEPTSVTFTGEKAQLERIEFLNNVLVMADNTYKKGYAFAKGYDQFDGEVNLTGLTVTPGVGTFTKYDNDTGRITIEDQTGGTTGAFLLIKEVPVFAQYQAGNNVITAQATLSVSNQSFVSEVEFGEIAKDGGNAREDGRLTILELQSGKYYVPFETIKDQYGNDMDADTLNIQKEGDDAGNKTLFVIPDNKGAFFATGKFGTIGDKTVLWIGATNAAKPGTMNLTLVGAGGATFEKEITVDDNPYIGQLSVSYPDLYAGDTKTEKLEFSAIDQYDKEIDLWDFKPTIAKTTIEDDTLVFDDLNNMTQTKTKIVASGATFNAVDYDYAEKTFKVTLNVIGTKRTLATFTTTTAGMKVSTVSLTIGERGTAGKVKSALASGANTQLDRTTTTTENGKTYGAGSNTALNFNKFVQFEDANGNSMVRGESDDYPQFLGALTAGNKVLAYDSKITNYNKFYWTLSKKKIEKGADEDNKLTGDQVAAFALDANGEIARGEMAGASQDFYVTLLASVGGGSPYYIVDDQDFHLTAVQGADASYAVSLSDTLYTNKEYKDTVGVKVTATTDQGETYTVANDRVKVSSGLFTTTDNTISGLRDPNPNPTPGTENVTVYVGGAPQNSVALNYTKDAPVAKSAWAKFATTYTSNGIPTTLVGKDFDGALAATRLKLTAASSVTIGTNGKLTIMKANALADTVTMGVDEQYGNTMADTKFYLDGDVMTTATTTIAAGDHTLEARNGAQSKMIYLTVTGTVPVTVAPTSSSVALATTTTLAPGTNNVKETALASGTLYLLSQADYNTLVNNGTEPAASIASVAVTAGDSDTTKTLTVPTDGTVAANATYHLVITDGAGAIQAHTAVKTAAAALTSAKLAIDTATATAHTSGTTSADTLTASTAVKASFASGVLKVGPNLTNTSDLDVLTCYDQFGNVMNAGLTCTYLVNAETGTGIDLTEEVTTAATTGQYLLFTITDGTASHVLKITLS